MHAIRYTVLSDPPPQKKTKIAYNSAYVQTETLNFTFARQAIIVYFYHFPTSKKMLCCTPNMNVPADYLLSIILDCTLIASKKSIQLN